MQTKIIAGLILTASLTLSAGAMATDSMMMKSDMMKKEMMHDDKMMDIKKDMMIKCIDLKKATRMEIKKFQKDNNLEQAGVIGKKTKAKLMMLGCMKDSKAEMMDMKKDAMMKKMDDKMMHATDSMMMRN